MAQTVAKIAVAAATYWVDKPYDYLIPPELAEKAVPGVRVYVPFSHGNRRSEGIILAVSDGSEYEKLKAITAVLDEEPLLSPEQIKLALFMRERFFCTVYDAVKAMLPAGLWFDDEGRTKVQDKTVEMTRLCVSPEEASHYAAAKRRRAPQQAELLEQLCSFECLPSRDLLKHTGASRQSLTALCKAGFVELYKKETFRRPEIHLGDIEPLPVLNDEQQQAFTGINALAMSGKSGAALLFGVTGSGKTSVYIHLITEQLARGRSVILLVPEIALTPQMIQTFSSHFGDTVAVLHSSLSVGERYDEFKRVRSGKARLVIGTRSAVFAPADKLGLIIIDEEQEETYKSENSPRYNARDVAIYRCAQAGCLLLLGSATPDIVSMYKARQGNYSLFTLRGRYNDMQLPQVEIVDMQEEKTAGNDGMFSETLAQALRENLDAGNQSLLLLNRRGYHTIISCASCNQPVYCPNCSIPMTYHKVNDSLMCHYCGHTQEMVTHCPSCGGEHLRKMGFGTQRLEEELKAIVPDARVLRMDADTTMSRYAYEERFNEFRSGKYDIMLGTQMIGKGLDFPNVTLVGVLSVDKALYAGDFRSYERTFSLVTQVVGRGGRGDKTGRAILQTSMPDHYVLRLAAQQAYPEFYAQEIALRRQLIFPPICDICVIGFTGMREQEVRTAAMHTADVLKAQIRKTGFSYPIWVLEPVPCIYGRVNGKFRYQLVIKCKNTQPYRSLIRAVLTEAGADRCFARVHLYADMNGDVGV